MIVYILTKRVVLGILYMRMIFSVVLCHYYVIIMWRRSSMEYSTLITLREGDICKVARIQAGTTATMRLYEMGFNTGARVQVLKNDRGPIIVGLGGHKVALGRGLAEKMLVARSK